PILQVLIDERDTEGALLLERLRDATEDATARREYQGALLRLSTRNIETETDVRNGYACLGSCDGQGTFNLLGCLQNPDGTMTIADLCVRAGADIRDGFVLPRQSQADLDSMLASLRDEAGSLVARISLGEAAVIVRAATQRTQTESRSIPADAAPA